MTTTDAREVGSSRFYATRARARYAQRRAASQCGYCGAESKTARCPRCKAAGQYKPKPETQLEWQRSNRDKVRGYHRKALLQLQLTVFNAYGGKCACCGETQFAFLTLDHINGGGSEHRKTARGGQHLFRILIREGFPDYIQLLCANCHLAKDRRGGCPHNV